MAKKRITELATETTLKDGQYVAIDHATDGTKKYNIGAELTNLKEDLNAELLRENLFGGWKQGYYAASNGAYEPNHSNYVCTVKPIPLAYREGLFWNLGDFPNKQACYMNCYDSDMNYIASAGFNFTNFKDFVTPVAISTNFINVAFVHFSISVASGTITPSTAPPLKIYRSALGLGDDFSVTTKNTAPYIINFTNLIYEYGTGVFNLFLNRVGLQEVIKAESDLVISVASGYKYAVFRFSSDTPSTSTEISNSGWVTADSIIKKGEYFLVNMAKSNDANFTPSVETYNAISIKPSYIYENDVVERTDISFTKGTFNANGTIDASGNGAITNIVFNPSDFNILGSASAVLALYKGSEYLGKINASGLLDKVAGSWKLFSGVNDVKDYLERYDADSILLCVLPTGSATIQDPQAWGDEHSHVFVSKYLGTNIALNTFEPKHNNGSNYLVTSALLKTGISTERIGTLTYHQAFCVYNGKYYSIDGENIAEQNESFTTLRNVALSTGHGNSLQLGSNGIAYASGWNDNKIYKVGLDDLTIDGVITLPTTGYTTGVIDEVRNLAYVFQRDSFPDHEDYYNFIVYDIANEQIISTRKILAYGAMQACDLFNDRIVVLNGLGNSTCPNGCRVYDTSGNILADYYIDEFSTVEPEGVCVDRDNHELLVSYVDKSVYKISL